MEDKNKIGFSTHSLCRALERIFQYEAPYTDEQLGRAKVFVKKNMTWNLFRERWVVEEFNAELVVVDGSVVTIIIPREKPSLNKPLTAYQKTYSKKYKQLRSARNNKSKYKD